MDNSVKLWNNFFCVSEPISPMYFLTGFHRSWVWQPTTCLKMLLKMVQNPMFCAFWMVLLPWDASNTICLELIGHFSQNMGLTPGCSWFCIFFTIFVFVEILVLNIFENILKPKTSEATFENMGTYSIVKTICTINMCAYIVMEKSLEAILPRNF